MVWDYHVIALHRTSTTAGNREAIPPNLLHSADDGRPCNPAASQPRPGTQPNISEPDDAADSSTRREGGSAQVQTFVFDLDTSLPWGCDFQRYATDALQPQRQLPPELRRLYRVVPAATYLRCFASNRQHMRRPDGSWAMPPPAYPCIIAKDGSGATDRLGCFWDMEPRSGGRLDRGTFGELLDERQLLQRFGYRPPSSSGLEVQDGGGSAGGSHGGSSSEDDATTEE